MYRPSEQSARLVGLRRRLKKEKTETLPEKEAALAALIESVKIINYSDEESPSLASVLAGEVKARLMMGGKFASKESVSSAIKSAEEEVFKSEDVISDITSKLKKFRL